MTRVMVLLKVLVLGAAAPRVTASPTEHFNSTHRDAKLFLVVNPKMCVASGKDGACLPYFQCSKLGGTVDGKCSLGLGECCVFEKTCGGSSSARVSYFTSSSQDSTDKGVCALSVKKAENVCQLRLDMKKLKLSEPDAEGKCVDQYLEVQGVTSSSPKICGTNTGQHLYVDVRADDGPFTVAVVNAQDNPMSSWEIEVEQLRCDSPDLAPSECSQYYTGLKGEVQSFNYDTTESSRLQQNDYRGSRHLQETYLVCVRQEVGYCSLKWTAAENEDYAFTMTGNLKEKPGFPLFNSGTDELCEFTDYLIIAGGIIPDEDDPSSVFCGSQFPESVTSTSFQAKVVANEVEFGNDDIDNRGFHLNYQQEKC
ncbi:uncharacterized protein LOC121859995 [Homarus americanus]|uniref:CUB domain-containing protein n=1 Tax=Homarus americanus TaxID=6706 RepID=A0A8J5T856_HOMAM|nr:uncharacterized protein LOC121859995 [Homarus americanus]XP_042212934.1 uncharacterized protein LOC121859995 [Homarus americanus]KAG7173894.1 hypothetical protein Hamer_G020042 [Homarus americanus]